MPPQASKSVQTQKKSCPHQRLHISNRFASTFFVLHSRLEHQIPCSNFVVNYYKILHTSNSYFAIYWLWIILCFFSLDMYSTDDTLKNRFQKPQNRPKAPHSNSEIWGNRRHLTYSISSRNPQNFTKIPCKNKTRNRNPDFALVFQRTREYYK